jgi:hypothetical protein
MAFQTYMSLPKVGQFVVAQTSYCERDGWYDQVCKFMGRDEFSGMCTVQTETGKYYHIPQQNIIKHITSQPIVTYNIDDTVEAQIDYHWKDGETFAFCKIIDYTIWGETLHYILTNLKDATQVYKIHSQKIKKRVQLQIPKFAVGVRVSYEFCNGHPFYAEYDTKLGYITQVIPWYDKVSYIIKFDDGSVETKDEYLVKRYVHPAPKKDPYTDIDFLNRQEDLLLEQLIFIRDKKLLV